MTACKTVIVIDDEDELRESLQDLLEAHGFQVAVARNGQEALDVLGQIELPCFILLDLMMPVMDGWEFLRERARQPRLAEVPVIIATSSPAQAPAGYQLLAKPINLAHLVDEVRRVCT